MRNGKIGWSVGGCKLCCIIKFMIIINVLIVIYRVFFVFVWVCG